MEVVEEVEKDVAEGTVPETARGCLLRTRRCEQWRRNPLHVE